VRCRSCNAEIFFLPTALGKKMPVDASSLSAEDKNEMVERRFVIYRHGEHVSHFGTCPQAKKWSGKKS
jgi:hypothetical protein